MYNRKKKKKKKKRRKKKGGRRRQRKQNTELFFLMPSYKLGLELPSGGTYFLKKIDLLL